MHLQLITNLQDFEKAKSYFPQDYLDSLKHKQKESIIARYFISKLVEKYFWIKNFLPQIDKNGVPVFENDIYWSISHKKELVFIWISKQKIGLDIETIKARDESLLDIFFNDEYKILWWKTWENFYILWTNKEAIIKKNLWKLDDMKNLKLEQLEQIQKDVWGIVFDKKLIISWNVVYNLVKEDKVLSITF